MPTEPITTETLDEVERALKNCLEKEVDYIEINALGDPEKQGTVFYGRAALARLRAERRK